MSQEVFEIVKKLNPKALETQIVFQCAPLFSGLKASNLLIVSRENEKDVLNIFQHTALYAVVLAHPDTRAAFLIYNKDTLEQHIYSAPAAQLLEEMGYKEYTLDSLIDSVGRLYKTYLKHGCDFPHELGLLLAYPPEDVRAYMIHHGRNALMTGYWKVYHNPDEKAVLFQKFESAKEKLLTNFSEGLGLLDIINQSVCVSTC